jgi:lipoprotein-releasing system permease protein
LRFLLFFVKRLIASRKKTSGISLFSAIASGGIALGVATLIVALNILAGYRTLFSEQLANLDSHIQTVGYSILKLPHIDLTINRIQTSLGSSCVDVQPFIDRLALVSAGSRKEGVTLKGVRSNYFDKKTLLHRVGGNLTLHDDNSIIIGKALADKLFIHEGSTLLVFALKNASALSADNMPAVRRFTVTGIYESGIERYDDAYAYIAKPAAEELFDFTPDQATGFEIKLQKIEQIPDAVATLKANLGRLYYHSTIYDMYAPIFTWIKMQEKPIPLVLGLIVLVAVFNIVSVSLMLALERSEHIGVLRTLGATKGFIRRAFLLQGLYLGILGIIIGNILAFILSYVQMTYHVVKLPATVYFTSAAPMQMPVESFVLVSAGAFLLTVLVALIPAYVAAKLSPITTLKFQ